MFAPKLWLQKPCDFKKNWPPLARVAQWQSVIKIGHPLHFSAIPEIRQSTIYYAGLLGRWDKQIVDQASDVPRIIFFYDFLKNSLQKSFQFIFLFFYKITKIKSFECPKSIKSIKEIILGTSDAWSTIRLSNRPSNPA